jgi:hypothetical protein
MRNRAFHHIQLVIVLLVFLFMVTPPVSAQVKANFMYTLSNFTGPIPNSWPRVSIDWERTEVYVLYRNLVRVFNQVGMEIYSFGDDLDLGGLYDLIVDREGNILLLSYRWSESKKNMEYAITRCNYRGEPISQMEIKGLPERFSSFSPNRILYRNGALYLINYASMTVVVTDPGGTVKGIYDILPLLDLEEKDKEGAMMMGFTLDAQGNMLFTIPTLFKAFRLSPEGKLAYFGEAGSIRGKFNIVSGIASDSQGNLLIVDKLKCAVMVFDKDFQFVTQFGQRGFRPGDLIAPDDITIDSRDRVYVTQARKRGVSVYRITHNK